MLLMARVVWSCQWWLRMCQCAPLILPKVCCYHPAAHHQLLTGVQQACRTIPLPVHTAGSVQGMFWFAVVEMLEALERHC